MSSRAWASVLLIGLAVFGCKLDPGMEDGSSGGSAPQAKDDTATTVEEMPITVAVLDNDDSGGGTLTITAVSATDSGQQPEIGSDKKTITYTPPPNFKGDDHFTYSVSNGQSGTETGANVTVTVRSIMRITGGTQNADEGSYIASFSTDGGYLVFDSDASKLAPDDTNGVSDIFLYEPQTGKTTRISMAPDGTESNGGSYSPSIGEGGSYVVFTSDASNLAPNDTNGVSDIFLYDRQAEKITRVSGASDGTQSNGKSYWPSLSKDGRYIVFCSSASNLAPGDTNGKDDIFLYERATGKTTRVSVALDGTDSNDGSYAPSLSADGNYVVFYSFASNLAPNDTNGASDIFLYERQTGNITRVSVASDGTQSNEGSHSPSLSADGRYVAFDSAASNLVSNDTNGKDDIFVYDRETKKTTRVSVGSNGSEGNAGSYWPLLSANGRYVAFYSSASNLAPGDTNGDSDIFVYDRETSKTARVSMASNGTESNDGSYWPSLSADGRYVAFTSDGNLVQGDDTNNAWNVFISVNK